MGTGSSALLWYFLCLAFVALVVALAAGLVVYGRAKEDRARAARRRARAGAPSAGSPRPPSSSSNDGGDGPSA